MAREDSAGLNTRTTYGVREIDGKEDGGRYFGDLGDTKKLEWQFTYEDANSGGALTAARNYNGVQEIPAGSYIVSATLEVLTAFDSAGGTATLDIGLIEADGTAIDADGIDAAIAETAIDTQYERVLCNGALVNALAGIGSAAGQLILTNAVEAYTAGEGRLVIEFQPPRA